LDRDQKGSKTLSIDSVTLKMVLPF
jgi:hypothetical protein